MSAIWSSLPSVDELRSPAGSPTEPGGSHPPRASRVLPSAESCEERRAPATKVPREKTCLPSAAAHRHLPAAPRTRSSVPPNRASGQGLLNGSVRPEKTLPRTRQLILKRVLTARGRRRDRAAVRLGSASLAFLRARRARRNACRAAWPAARACG